MDGSSLLGLLEQDREMILAGIAGDRSPAGAQAVLEKAFDRLMLRCAEQYRDPQARNAAQLVLSSLKSALPLMDSVAEVRRWQRTAGDAARKRRPGPLAWVALIGGAVLVAGALMGLAFAGVRGGLLTAAKAVLPALAGMAAVFWAGTRFAAPRRESRDAPSDVRDEYLVDADKVWHHLRGMLLLADSALDNLTSRAAAERRRAEAASDGSPISPAQAELFAGLLEGAYAQDNADAREMAESIRFFLHGVGVEVVDCDEGREGWFEYLPAQASGTIRPALVSGGRLVKKGLASL